MFQLIALICIAAMPAAACQPETALNRIPLGHVHSETECAIKAQWRLASTALVPRPGLEYAKLICRRDR